MRVLIVLLLVSLNPTFGSGDEYEVVDDRPIPRNCLVHSLNGYLGVQEADTYSLTPVLTLSLTHFFSVEECIAELVKAKAKKWDLRKEVF